jgi:hypothetical protein
MNIKRITLNSNGFKGAEITYLKQDFKNQRPFINEIVEKRKHPIHMDFEKLFKDLREHLLDICQIANNRLSEVELKSLVLDTDVISIEFDNEHFLITGEKQVFDEKRIKLKTCKVQQSDDYEGYHQVMGIIEALKIEATSYMDGLKIVSDREMMLRWLEAKKDAGMTKDQFEAMTEDEQKNYMNKTLNSKFGADIEISEDSEEDDDNDPIALPEDETPIEIPEKKSKKSKKSQEAESETSAF